MTRALPKGSRNWMACAIPSFRSVPFLFTPPSFFHISLFQKSCLFKEDFSFSGGRAPVSLDFDQAPHLDAPPPRPKPKPKRKRVDSTAEPVHVEDDEEDAKGDDDDNDEDEEEEGAVDTGPTKYVPYFMLPSSTDFPFHPQKDSDDR
jgi:hypothetical protein